jgi:hypothetical protein
MRHNLETLGLLDCVGTRVRLEIGNDYVNSAFRGHVTVSEHLESLPDARRISQIDF